MGNAQHPSDTKSMEDIYHLVKKGPGGLTMFEDRATGKEYVLKEMTSNDQSHFGLLKEAVNKRRAAPHQHLLAVKEVETKVESNFCSNEYKLLLMVEYPFRNLFEEVEERRLTDEYFTENELWSVLYSCALGLAGLYAYGGRHESLCSSRVFIEKDGLVKVGDPFLLSQHPNTDCMSVRNHEQHIYLSPEQIQFMVQPKHQYLPQKSDVFTLGMVLLEAAGLEFLDEFYEESHTIINERRILAKIAQVKERYGSKLARVFEQMLDFMPSRRTTLDTIVDFVQGETFDEEEEAPAQKSQQEEPVSRTPLSLVNQPTQ